MKNILLLFLVTSILILGQNKSKFDIQQNHSEEGLSKTQNIYETKLLSNNFLEATMLKGGYFTFGTNKGISNKSLDDNCSITFGHPYAMTSYPLFSIDGTWNKYDEFFTDNISPQKKTDTLLLSANNNMFSIEFSIIIQEDGKSIKLLQTITNTDSIPHNFGSGLVFDPSLGKFGDGYIGLPDELLKTEKIFNEAEVPSKLSLWEKSTDSKGIGVELDFVDNKPEKIIAGNWTDLYQHNYPDFEINSNNKLYDLDLVMYWLEEELQPSESKISETILKQLQPDFSSSVFTRWDLPGFISMEDNVMFPRKFDSYLEIQSSGNESFDNAKIKIDVPSSLNLESSEYTVSINNAFSLFQKIPLSTNIIYEDKVIDIGITITKNGQVLDELHRNIFIPATELTDTGLVIVDDSINTSSFPNIDMIFSVEVESAGNRIFNLQKDNIFLYENGSRIEDFNLEKYSSGGSNLADIVFVLDCSGSMGNEIDQVRNNIGEFADSLSARGFDYRIGIVTFSTTVDDVWDLTNDIEQVKRNLASITLWGGIEDSPAALYRASELSLRPGSKRTFIWITDEPYPENSYTKEQIVNRMLGLGITVHGVGLTSLQTAWFNPIVLPTGGNFYDINGNFRDILLDVSRMEAEDKYKLSYNSKIESTELNEITLEVHIAGLGVIKSYSISGTGNIEAETHLSFYPNPFNPQITFVVNKRDYKKGELTIYNLLGQRVRKFSFNENNINKINWNATNDFGSLIGSGFYIVQLVLTDKFAKVHSETAKILYLK